MDPVEYYVTTFTNAFKRIMPILVFLIGGYFIFIKLPFFFFRKRIDRERKNLVDKKPFDQIHKIEIQTLKFKKEEKKC